MSELFTDDGIPWRFILPAILVVFLGLFTLAYGVSRGGIGGRGGEVPPVQSQQSQTGPVPQQGGQAVSSGVQAAPSGGQAAPSESAGIDTTGTDSAPGR